MRKEILLAHFPKITVKRYQQLLAAFSSVDKIWEAEFDDLKKAGFEDELTHEFLSWRKHLDVEKIEKILDQEKIHCITTDEKEYPELLKQIYDPPICLFIRGHLTHAHFNLAVVGTRKFTQYGKQVTEELVSELARHGVTIVSGLAFGIDSIAHHAAIVAHGNTIAVLGSGINKRHIYPSAHMELSERIIDKGGAIISEYPPGTLPNKYTFPRRNRIIAGISLGTLVIEAAEKSGALITAECTLENGREIFAIPQNITSITSTGVNNLIKSGAKLITCAEDIIDSLDLQDIAHYVTNTEILPDSPSEAQLLQILTREPIHVDAMAKRSNLSSREISATLVLMEMKGKVKNVGNMMYVVAR